MASIRFVALALAELRKSGIKRGSHKNHGAGCHECSEARGKLRPQHSVEQRKIDCIARMHTHTHTTPHLGVFPPTQWCCTEEYPLRHVPTTPTGWRSGKFDTSPLQSYTL